MHNKLFWTIAPRGALIARLAAGSVLLLLALALKAQPTGGRILSDITVSGSDTCKLARISFNFPNNLKGT
jgi:hypothetical protein